MANTENIGKIELVSVKHGDKFPPGAIRACGRGLNSVSADQNEVDSYIALWKVKPDESLFGCAYNRNGHVEAVFVKSNTECCSSKDIGQFFILTCTGSEKRRGYELKWVPGNQTGKEIKSGYSLVSSGVHAICVVQTELDGRVIELLGTCNFSGTGSETKISNARTVHKGAVCIHKIDLSLPETCWVLCQKPVKSDIEEIIEKVNLSQEEVGEIEDTFKFFDRDGNGRIDCTELKYLLKSLGLNLNKQELETVKEKYDNDKNGTIEFVEFLRFMADQKSEDEDESESEESQETESEKKEENSQKAESFGEFHDQSLEAHNYYRAKHNAPSLVMTAALNEYAQEWADRLAHTNSFHHRSQRSFGENLFMATGMNVNGWTAVNSWYNEISMYNFRRQGFSSQTGHFTQVVWKGSTEVGLGVARNGNSVYVVANYNPPGNMMNAFGENVLPPN